MTARAGAVLYTPEILALTVELAKYPLVDSYALKGEAHSRVCGSRVSVGIAADDVGRIVSLGAKVSACAIGQASAALFLRSASGLDAVEIRQQFGTIRAWLDGGEEVPVWPGMAVLAPARVFTARHAAIQLPWTAALAALSNRGSAD